MQSISDTIPGVVLWRHAPS